MLPAWVEEDEPAVPPQLEQAATVGGTVCAAAAGCSSRQESTASPALVDLDDEHVEPSDDTHDLL